MAGLSCELVIVIQREREEESLAITVGYTLCRCQRIVAECNEFRWISSMPHPQY